MSEKDAIAGILQSVTDPLFVPLGVVRGFSSATFLHAIAENILEKDKPAWIHYFGDHDPSGEEISAVTERTISELAPGAEIHFERLAVTEQQITQYDLPTRPTKKASHKKDFKGQSVEVDALPVETLRSMARNAVQSRIDRAEWNETKILEKRERETLGQLVDEYAEQNYDFFFALFPGHGMDIDSVSRTPHHAGSLAKGGRRGADTHSRRRGYRAILRASAPGKLRAGSG